MNFFGLSPAAFAIGALVAAGALAVLHLLRVRLRRQEVDTLLFFRAAAAVQRPRSLLAKFSRPLAYLFGLLLLLTACRARSSSTHRVPAPVAPPTERRCSRS
jgi:hypothetical protein